MVFLDALKATAIVCVVAVHTIANVKIEGQSRDVLMFLFGAIAVPLFFLVDGFLFSEKWTDQESFDYGQYVAKSATRLLVPWVAFTALYALCRLGLEWLSVPRENILLGNDLRGIGKVIYLSGLAQQMYFLLSLFLVRLTSIGCVRLLRSSKWAWIAIFTFYSTIYAFSHATEWFLPGADPLLLAFWGFQFYLLGVVFQKWQETLAPMTVWFGPVCLIVSLGIWSLLPRVSPFLSQLIYLTGSYATVFAIATRTRWGFSLGKDTMGIYLLHAPIVLWGVTALVSRYIASGQVLVFVVTTCLTVLFSWLGSRLMSKSRIGRLFLGQPHPVHLET